MAKFSFVNYVKEIEKISKEQKVDMGVAYDKFRTDVRLGSTREYNTGNTLTGFDFAGASKIWNALTEDEQKACYEEWHEFLTNEYHG